MPSAYTSSIDAAEDKDKQEYARKTILSRLTGVEGIPYQFMDSVDRRPYVSNTIEREDPTKKFSTTYTDKSVIGRKYAEKIISRIPLLFLTPCQPLFMDAKSSSFTQSDRNTVIGGIVTGSDVNELIQGSGKFYSVEFAYARYYSYLNFMLAAVASFLGLQNEEVYGTKLGAMDWSRETQSAFKTYFDSRENLVFYLDGMETIDESFSNSTTQSALASQVNGFSDIGRELDFLFGSSKAGVMGSITDATTSVTEGISGALGNISSNLGAGVVGSLLGTGVSSLLNGGKISFPDIWSDASYDKGYSITFKLRSPDNDSLSIFLNVLKPYCKLLCLVLPHAFAGNPNGYRTPFLVKGYSKGLFSIDMGMITGLSAVKGAACCWNDDGLPTQIDVTIELTDLYKQLYMSGYKDDDDPVNAISSIAIWKDATNVKRAITNNTSYMDFLANMAGLNINQMEMFRRTKTFMYLMSNNIQTIPSTLGTRFGQTVENLIRNIYIRT